MNRIQFQAGLSIPEFLQQYGTQAQCEEALEAAQYVLQINGRKTFQCAGCGHQTSLTAGTVFHSTKLPLTVWFLAILGVSYPHGLDDSSQADAGDGGARGPLHPQRPRPD